MPDAISPPPLQVACLCAQWCRTCDAYLQTLQALQSALADASVHFHWIDIEDEAEFVGDLDIENFPTLLIARGPQVLFFGTVTPHAGTLERLVRGAHDGSLHAAGTMPAEAVRLATHLGTHRPL